MISRKIYLEGKILEKFSKCEVKAAWNEKLILLPLFGKIRMSQNAILIVLVTLDFES